MTARSAGDHSYLVQQEAGVLTLTFNRPKQGNAIPPHAVPGLIEMFGAAQADTAVRVILIRSEGRVFSAGADRDGLARSIQQDAASRQADFAGRLALVQNLFNAITAFDRPIVVALGGAAAGAGLLYPLAADFVIASDEASLVFAHQRVGLSPDGGVTALLPRLVGPRIARSLLLGAAQVDAQEALRLLLVDRIVPSDQLQQEALALARRLAGAPQLAIRTAKRLVNLAASGASFDEQLKAEAAGIVASVGDADFVEGVAAALEKRTPRFPSAPAH